VAVFFFIRESFRIRFGIYCYCSQGEQRNVFLYFPPKKGEPWEKFFIEGLNSIKNIKIYGINGIKNRVGVVSFNKTGYDCVTFAQLLNDKFNIASRAGYHCAYSAHKTIGSDESGTVRFSFGKFNTKEEVLKALYAINIL
jgi:selenocysteine lyase/cysteine desulfurase